MSEFERRFTAPEDAELRAAADGDAPVRKLRGLAAVFNKDTDSAGMGFVERIAPGAFDKVMGDDVRALLNHDPNQVLGRTASGTLQLELDKRGLVYSVDLPDTQVARDLHVLVARGDVTQSSFGFVVENDEIVEKKGVIYRTITSLRRLFDVSPATFPAYRQTSVQARSLQELRDRLTGESTEVSKTLRMALLRRMHALSLSAET